MTAGWHEALSFLGVGRVPFMVIWVTLFLFTGFAGLFVNRVLFVRAAGAYAGWWLVPVLAGALFVGVLAVRLFSRVAARFVDVGGHGATAKHELTGKIGQVASPMIDGRHGEIRVHDDRGNELLVHGCLRAGDAALRHGTRVILVSYDAGTQLFWASACPEIDDVKDVKRS
jgi:membrane protein implicated in regulation of membrane protease activity